MPKRVVALTADVEFAVLELWVRVNHVLPSYTPKGPTHSRNHQQTNYNMVLLSHTEVPEVLPPMVRKALMPPPMAIVPVPIFP